MKIIELLSEKIEEETEDAREYAECSLRYRDDDPELSRTFSYLANEELNHVSKLHEQVVRIIKKYREDHGDPPQKMLDRYEYLHEKHIERVAKVKALLS